MVVLLHLCGVIDLDCCSLYFLLGYVWCIVCAGVLGVCLFCCLCL